MKFILLTFLYASIVFFLIALFGAFVAWDFSAMNPATWGAAARAMVVVISFFIGAIAAAGKL